jgi:PKD repeat protein/fibronectin type 3 domain-containing protein
MEKMTRSSLMVAALLCALSFLFTPALPAQNRGLWVDADRVAILRQLVADGTSHHGRVFNEMRTYLDNQHVDIITVPSRLGSNWNYDRSYLAQQAALVALLSADPADRTLYAGIAYDALYAMYADPDSGGHQLLGNNQHLSKATVAMGFALGYEFAGEFWTSAQRDWVRGKMIEALDAWPSLGHTNFGGDFSSNWLAVVRGAEVCMLLAAGEESDRPLRYRNLRTWLQNNANTHGPRGWGQEGNYYLAYGQIFALPAMQAMRAIGDPEMALALTSKQHHLVPLYGSMFSEAFDTVNWGVGGSIWDGGFASLQMAYAPEGEKAYVRWWFDRFMGVLNPAPDHLKFDRDRQGRVWALLAYPEHVAPADPAARYPVAIEDTGGFYMRSGWNDVNDVLVFLGTDKAHYNRGWDAPDALSLVVLGQGNRYITGPGNTAHQASAKDLFSTILVNDAVPETGRTGGSAYFALSDNAAYAIATGGNAYANMGVSTAHRHLLADFSGTSGSSALLSLRDKLRSSSGSHEYRWQINTGQGQVAVQTLDGRPAFTITYPGNDGYLRGWVVHPANATVQTAPNRLFFNTTATDADIWVVLAVGNGTAPAASISGSGLDASVTLNGTTLTWDEGSDRLQNSAVTPTALPVATFTATPTSGALPLSVTFNAAASSSPHGIAAYAWDFGDGSTATGPHPSHTFTTPGIHKVSLRITDQAGRHEVANRTVVAGHRWPTANFSVSPSSGQPPLTVTLDPGASNHPNGLPLTYEWDLGDGTIFTATDNAPFCHVYQTGNFTPRLVVRDPNGGFDARQQSVAVANQAPIALVDWDVGGGEAPLTVNFFGDASYDPDGDAITFLWNFGDGNTSTESNPTHTFTTPGDYTVTLTVTDDGGATGSRSLPNPIRVRSGANPLQALDPLDLPGLLRGVEYSLHYNDIDQGVQRMPFYLTPELITLLWRGVLDNFRIWPSDRSDRYAFHYRGYLDVPETGVYTFYVDSRNGARLRVAGEELLSDNTRFGTVDAWNTLALEAGLHEIDFIYYANEAGSGPFHPYLALTWSGPGFARNQVDSTLLYWRPGRPEAQFFYSRAPNSALSPVTYNFDAATSRAFGGDTIASYEWEFPGGIVKTGRTVSHAFTSGTHRVLLHVTTNAGITTSLARTVTVPVIEDYTLFGGTDRSIMPGAIVRARGEFLPNGLAESAFDGDKTTRWLDLVLNSWIEIEFRHEGQLTPYVVSEYRFTSLTAWNERDPYSWEFYGSHDGVNWTLLDTVTENAFSGNHPRTNSFPISNTTAYAYYRFANIQATATSAAPDAVGLNLIELIDHGTGAQPSSVPPVASLSIPQTAPAVGQTFSLDGSASFDPDGYPLFYEWDFGDGQTQRGWELSQVTHTYHTDGNYTVVMTVTDALGSSASVSQATSAQVVPNADPVATYTYLATAPAGRTEITFDASASYDPDGDPIAFHWELGDGMVASGPVVTHTYGVGAYTPLLIVTDDRGGRATYAQEVIVPLPEDLPLSIGINFSGRNNEYEDALLPNEIAGLVPQANWNNVSGNWTDFRDSDGADTFLSLGFSGSGAFTYGSPTTPRSADHKLMRTGRGVVNGAMNFVNVPYAVYDVYVYHGARREDHVRDEAWWIRLASDTFDQTTWVRQSAFTWNGTLAESAATSGAEAIDGHGVVVFRGVTDQHFSLTSGSHLGRTLAHAIQIVDASGGTIVPPLNPPQPPVAFTGEATSSSIVVLSWEEPAGVVAGYRLERAPAGTESWSLVTETTATGHTDTGRTHSTTYRYRVNAFNTGGASAFAGPLEVTTQPPASDPPAAPVGFTASATSATTVFLQWEAVSGPVDGYRLERAIGESSTWALVAETSALNFTHADLQTGTTYRYRVRAFNEAGPSPWSAERSAQTPGEFGSGEEIPVVVWGPGAFYNNPDGSGDWTGLAALTSGTAQLGGLETGFRTRAFGLAALEPAYKPEGPPSGRFNIAGVIFNVPGTTNLPTVFLRLDGRNDGDTRTEIEMRTTASGSQHAATLIWWSKEDFLGGFDVEALDAAEAFAIADVDGPYHLLVRQNGQHYISTRHEGRTTLPLATQTWSPVDPASGGVLGLFANTDGDQVSAATGLTFAPASLGDIEAIGLYTERVGAGTNGQFYLGEFRVVAVLPAPEPPPAPTGLTASAVDASSIGLSWNAVDAPVDGYRLERAPAGTSSWELVIETTATAHLDGGLSPETTYAYRVAAFEAEDGTSEWSDMATATTPAAPPPEPVAVVSWGPGAFFNNPDGSGDWTGLAALASGTLEIEGQVTGYRGRAFGLAPLQPAYKPEGPPSGRFNIAGVVFNVVGTTNLPTVFLRLDGRNEGDTRTEIEMRTTASGSQHAATLIWWSKEDFLGGFDAEALDAASTYAEVDVVGAYHLLVRQNGQHYISPAFSGATPIALGNLTWAAIDPATGGFPGLFANINAGQVSPADELSFAPVTLGDIEAIGLYAERTPAGGGTQFYLGGFTITHGAPVEPPPANEPPVAALAATPVSGEAPLTVSFNASASSDPDNDPLTFAWTFGDGATAGDAALTSHTYTAPGTYVATVTVSDGDLTDTASVTITVLEPGDPDPGPGPDITPGEATVFYAGGGANTRFHDAHELSDGTLLVAGRTDSLSWIPLGTPLQEVTHANLPAPTGSAHALLLRLNGTATEILEGLYLPAGAVTDFRWIRTTEVPGEPTGMVYLSGRATGGYFIARLNANFVNATPAGFDWVFAVEASSGHENDQPWDVGNDGRVIYAYGGEWDAQIGFLDPNGQRTTLPQLRASHFTGTEFERGVGTEFPGASYSAIRLPTDNTSWTDAELFFVGPDGNGSLRQGTWPIDIMVTHSFDTGEPVRWINNRAYGYNGYRTAGRHWIGSIAIDRRTNDFYYGFNIKSIFWDAPANIEQPDFEPAVIAYQADGTMKWWNRLYREAADTTGDGQIDTTWVSPPDQYIDGMAVDYSVPLSAGGQVVAVGRAHGNNTSNFWSGNDIALNPAAKGFQNRFTGTEGNIHIGWMGRLTADTGDLLAATYVAGFFRRIINNRGNWPTQTYPEPIHDGWPNHNAGWPDLTTTSIQPNSIRIGADGRVHVVGNGPRMVTTSNAFQKLPRRLGHNNPVLNEGTSPWNDWARAYEPNFEALAYSSTLTGQWTYPDDNIDAEPVGAGNVKLRGIFPLSGGLLAVGHHSNNAGTSAGGNDMPTNNVPAWGSASYQGITGVIAIMPFHNDRPAPAFTIGANGESISVDAGASTSASTIASFAWTFGDGATATGATATHTYTANGRYLVGLRVTNASGHTAHTHQWVEVDSLGPVGSAPAFTLPPASQTVKEGAALTLTAGVSGDPAPELQWFKDGQPIAGAHTDTLALSAAGPADAGDYWVVATNEHGTATSATATVTIDLVPTILTSSLPDGMVGEAYSVDLSASSGDAPLAWSVFSGDLPDGLGLTTGGTLAGTPAEDGNFAFTVMVTDANGDFDTRALSLMIEPAPAPLPEGGPVPAEAFYAIDGETLTVDNGVLLVSGLTDNPLRGVVANLPDTYPLDEVGDWVRVNFLFTGGGNNNQGQSTRFGLFEGGAVGADDDRTLTDSWTGFFHAVGMRSGDGATNWGWYRQHPGGVGILALHTGSSMSVFTAANLVGERIGNGLRAAVEPNVPSHISLRLTRTSPTTIEVVVDYETGRSNGTSAGMVVEDGIATVTYIHTVDATDTFAFSRLAIGTVGPSQIAEVSVEVPEE